MGIDFKDMSGRPRPVADVEAALLWAKMKIVKPDYSDPAGVIHCVTIKDALEELLMLRAIIGKAKESGA